MGSVYGFVVASEVATPYRNHTILHSTSTRTNNRVYQYLSVQSRLGARPKKKKDNASRGPSGGLLPLLWLIFSFPSFPFSLFISSLSPSSSSYCNATARLLEVWASSPPTNYRKFLTKRFPQSLTPCKIPIGRKVKPIPNIANHLAMAVLEYNTSLAPQSYSS